LFATINTLFCTVFTRFILRHRIQANIWLLSAKTPLYFALYDRNGADPVDYATNVVLQTAAACFRPESNIRLFQA
jgi:hypothetical protein